MWEAINTTHLDLRDAATWTARLRTGPYSVYQLRQGALRAVLGPDRRARCCATRRSAFLAAGGRIESADMVLRMLRVALPPASADGDPRHAAQALALLQAVGGFQAFRRAVPAPPNAGPVARFLLFERAYPDCVAASVDALHEALARADADPRNSEPVLRLSRLGADLEFHRRAAARRRRPAARPASTSSRSSSASTGDIADRYFAGASAPTMRRGRA